MKTKVWLEKKRYGEYRLHFAEPTEDYNVDFDRAKKTVRGTFRQWLSKAGLGGNSQTYCNAILSIFGGENKMATALGDSIKHGDLIEVTLTLDGPFAPHSFADAVGNVKVIK